MDTNVFRREMHRHPELPYKESFTSDLIACELENACVDFRHIDNTGIVARIKGNRGNHNRCVVLCSSIGASAVEERTGVDFSSQNEGVMHSAGNDCNTAMVLGVLKRLQASPDFEGTLFGVFHSGDGSFNGGAQNSLKEALLNDFNVAAVISNIMSADLDIGEIGFCPGKFIASYDHLHCEVRGVGGTAVARQSVKDAVVALAELILRLKTLNSEVCAVSVGKVTAEGSADCVPDVASCEGVMRTFDEKLRRRVKEMIDGAAQEIEYKHDVDVRIAIDDRSACVENNKQLSYEAMLFADSLGLKVRDMERGFAVADFGYYTQLYPSLMYCLGVGRESGCVNGATFLPEDRVLEVGEEFMYQLALNILNR